MTHKMIYRKATAADYEGVLGILPPSEVMGGADYVPDYYHSIIEQPNNLAYVALADSKIVRLFLM